MKTRGLTLVEVLVVISIIALITGIGFPVAQRARNDAKAALCSSNLRQLMLGLFAYESLHGRFPYSRNIAPIAAPPGGYAGYGNYDTPAWWWFNYTTDYSRKKRNAEWIVFCPAKPLKDTLFERNVLWGNYGLNQSICKFDKWYSNRAEFRGTPLSSAELPHPSRTLLIADAGYSAINWMHAMHEPPVTLAKITEDSSYIPGMSINRKKTNLLPEQENDAFTGRHPQKTVNVGFADGHISREKAQSLLVEKTGDTYRNRSPLWRPQ